MVTYQNSLDGITLENLKEPFFIGWPNPPQPPTHLRILQGSAKIVLAVDSETQQVVGFINAISDGVMTAFIPLLEVTPAYKNQGIGTELVNRLVEQLSHVYAIDLTADEDVQPFYDRLGFWRSTGMVKRNYDRQSGE